MACHSLKTRRRCRQAGPSTSQLFDSDFFLDISPCDSNVGTARDVTIRHYQRVSTVFMAVRAITDISPLLPASAYLLLIMWPGMAIWSCILATSCRRVDSFPTPSYILYLQRTITLLNRGKPHCSLLKIRSVLLWIGRQVVWNTVH